MKRDLPWMLVVSVVWFAFGLLFWWRGDSGQAVTNFCIGLVFLLLGVSKRRARKA